MSTLRTSVHLKIPADIYVHLRTVADKESRPVANLILHYIKTSLPTVVPVAGKLHAADDFSVDDIEFVEE